MQSNFGDVPHMFIGGKFLQTIVHFVSWLKNCFKKSSSIVVLETLDIILARNNTDEFIMLRAEMELN